MTSDSSPIPDQRLEERLGLIATGTNHRRRLRLWLALAGLAVVVAGILILPRGQDAPGYSTASAMRGNLRITVTATGELEPVNQVDVGTEISGTIRSVDVDFNDVVTTGQVLARLDTDELQAQVLQGRANLKAAQARVAEAQATREETRLKHDRCLELARKQMCSQEEVDSDHAAFLRADAEVASSEAQVEVARAALDAQQTRLQKAAIRSPIDGLVLARQIEPGQTVAASLQTPVLFVLAEDLRDMELHIDVDEADVGLVEEGQSAAFTVDAYPDRIFPASITQVRFAPQTEGGVVTYETVLRVDNGALLLRPGMTATASVTVAEVSNGLLVPNAALRFQPPTAAQQTRTDDSFLSHMLPRRPRGTARRAAAPRTPGSDQQVWVLRAGEPTPVAVRTGLSDGVQSEIVGGELTEGDLVITGMDRGAG